MTLLQLATVRFPSGDERIQTPCFETRTDHIEMPYRCYYCGGKTGLDTQRFCTTEHADLFDQLPAAQQMATIITDDGK